MISCFDSLFLLLILIIAFLIKVGSANNELTQPQGCEYNPTITVTIYLMRNNFVSGHRVMKHILILMCHPESNSPKTFIIKKIKIKL